MLRNSDIASVAGCMLAYRGTWYDKQKDFLSDRRYRARCVSGCGNMVNETVVVELGGFRYTIDLDYRKGWATVSGRTCWHVELVDGGPGWRFERC